MKNAQAKQIETCSAVHLALAELQAVDLPLARPHGPLDEPQMLQVRRQAATVLLRAGACPGATLRQMNLHRQIKLGRQRDLR